MYATEIETHKAKKQHRCDWCWQFVNADETYKRYRYYNGGDVGTVKMHPECHDVMQDEAREEGGWFEWTPGQERPAPSNAIYAVAYPGTTTHKTSTSARK